MEQSFDEILESFLDAYEQGSKNSVDSIISQKMEEFDASEDTKKYVEATSQLFERYKTKRNSLNEAKAEGRTREEWMQQELLAMQEKYNLSDEQVLKMQEDFTEAIQDEIDNELNNKG